MKWLCTVIVVFLFACCGFSQDTIVFNYFSMYNKTTQELTNVKHEQNSFIINEYTKNVTRNTAEHSEVFNLMLGPDKKMSEEGNEFIYYKAMDKRGYNVEISIYQRSLLLEYTIDNSRIMAIFSNENSFR